MEMLICFMKKMVVLMSTIVRMNKITSTTNMFLRSGNIEKHKESLITDGAGEINRQVQNELLMFKPHKHLVIIWF